jgi:ADP-ribose pyrophosphatase YjhB (NUDIX family)
MGPLTDEEYRLIYSKVPRLAVDIVVRNRSGAVYLTKRAHDPCRGLWHIPGGTVRFGEFLQDAVRRIAERELSIEVIESKNCGVIEYPSHFDHGLDSPIGLVFEAIRYAGTPRVNAEASEGGWFSRLPGPMHADQDAFLLSRGYVTKDVGGGGPVTRGAKRPPSTRGLRAAPRTAPRGAVVRTRH